VLKENKFLALIAGFIVRFSSGKIANYYHFGMIASLWNKVNRSNNPR
jgi:hypothetical protein